MQPTPGRILHYKLTIDDAERINARIRTAAMSGNYVEGSEVVPLIVTRAWPGQMVNGQALLDGDDSIWLTSVPEGTGMGTWSWPPMAAPSVSTSPVAGAAVTVVSIAPAAAEPVPASDATATTEPQPS